MAIYMKKVDHIFKFDIVNDNILPLLNFHIFFFKLEFAHLGKVGETNMFIKLLGAIMPPPPSPTPERVNNNGIKIIIPRCKARTPVQNCCNFKLSWKVSEN